jgi:hypothetical protein
VEAYKKESSVSGYWTEFGQGQRLRERGENTGVWIEARARCNEMRVETLPVIRKDWKPEHRRGRKRRQQYKLEQE